jgi:Protein of unknown function DUF58
VGVGVGGGAGGRAGSAGRAGLSLTTRGVIAVCLAPISAVAGVLVGAEEFVLVAIALATLVLCGAVQSSYRAGRARGGGGWRVSVALAAPDAEVDSLLGMTVVLAASGSEPGSGAGSVSSRSAEIPIWLEDPQQCWGPGRPRLPNPSLVLPVSLPEGEDQVQLHFLAPTEQRGIFKLRGPRVWCFDSFGLVAQLVAVGPTATISVYPVPLVVELGEDVLGGDPGLDDLQPLARLRQPRRDSFGDFAGLRTYVPGDRLRLLYWPALARSGELMVRDFEDDGPRRVHVVADVRALIGEPGHESVLATVAGVGLLVLAQGSIVELSTTSGERVAIGPGPLGDLALLRAIANIETVAPIPASGSTSTRWRRRPGRGGTPVRGTDERELRPFAGSPVVVTTESGLHALPASFGFAHVVVAP